MLHFPEKVGGDIGDRLVVVVERVVQRNAEHLLVHLVAVAHPEHPQRAHVDFAGGEGGHGDHHQGVQRIVVLRVGLRKKAVVAGIVDGAEEHAVQPEEPGPLVQLVLVAAAAGDLDHHRHLVGRVGAGRQVVPGMDHRRALHSSLPRSLAAGMGAANLYRQRSR